MGRAPRVFSDSGPGFSQSKQLEPGNSETYINVKKKNRRFTSDREVIMAQDYVAGALIVGIAVLFIIAVASV